MNSTLSKLYQTASKVYPQDIECVFDSPNAPKGAIFISNIEAAQNINTLKKFGIKGILTAASGAIISHPKSQIPFYKYIPGQDHQRFDLSKYFDQCADFIKQTLQQTNILVHCMAGISRSVTLVIAHLIKHKGMNYQAAFSQVKSRRKIIHPNDGFIQQLKRYETQIKRKSSPDRSPQNRNRYDTSPYQSPIKKYLQHQTQSPSKYYQSKYQSPSKHQSPTKYQSPSKFQSKRSLYQSPTKTGNTTYQSSTLNLNTESPSKYALKTRYENLSPSKYQAEDLNNQFKNSRAVLDKYLKTQHIRGQSHLITSTNNQSPSKYTTNKVDTADIDKKIADIRKKYADYSQQLKMPLKNTDVSSTILTSTQNVNSSTYRPQLRHMSSMNTNIQQYYDQNKISNYDQEDTGSYQSITKNSLRRLTSMNEATIPSSRYGKY